MLEHQNLLFLQRPQKISFSHKTSWMIMKCLDVHQNIFFQNFIIFEIWFFIVGASTPVSQSKFPIIYPFTNWRKFCFSNILGTSRPWRHKKHKQTILYGLRGSLRGGWACQQERNGSRTTTGARRILMAGLLHTWSKTK
jgi:hypothetical protein